MNRRPASRPAPSREYAPQRRPMPQGQSAPQRRSAPPQGRYASRRSEPQRRPVREAPPRSVGGGWMKDVALLLTGGAVVAVLALMLQGRWPAGFPLATAGAGANTSANAVSRVTEIHSGGPLRVNEIMTGNRRTFTAEDGSTPDWVEVANVGASAVNLEGWSLAKTENTMSVFTFPDMTLQPQECALVLADSRLRAEAGEALHAPFRLSSAGDTLMLFNPSGTAVEAVNIPALNADCSYARAGEAEWETSTESTPGLPNTEESRRALTEPSGDSPVVLSEIVASNDSALADENGEYYDYIELYNRSGEAVDLTGWYLSDDAAQPRKWRFPAASLGPGEYLVVYASGLNRTEDPAHLHASFSLSSEGEQAVLTDAQGRVMDRAEFGLLKGDEAWSLGADGAWKSAPPSPGAVNP